MITLQISNAITFEQLAEQTRTPEQVNFVRKVILDEGGDPNKYFEQQRTILKGEDIIQSHSLDNGDS